MNHTEFIKALPGDVDIVVAMRMMFSNEYAGTLDEARERQLRENLAEYFTRELNKNYLCWYAKVDNEIASIAGMVIRVNPGNAKNPSGIWGYVMSVYTIPKFRRMGLSKKLLDKLLESAKERGVTAFELHATDDGAPVYERVGFERFKEPTYRKYL